MTAFLLAAFLTVTTLGRATSVSACDETFTVDSTTYDTPDYWCGRTVDSTTWAKPADLKPLAGRFTYKEFNIYLHRDAVASFELMAKDALKDSVELIVKSGYRSPDFQRSIIKKRLKRGVSMATIMFSVAPPGYSEHHTGCAVDLSPGGVGFAKTTAYTWLHEHAAEYGWVETYAKDVVSDSIAWEPWHWFYAGEAEE